MVEVALLALEAIGLIGGGLVVALALCWFTNRLGKLTHTPVVCIIVAAAAAVLTLSDAFSLGNFPRVSAAFSLPMLLFLWDSVRVADRAPTTRAEG